MGEDSMALLNTVLSHRDALASLLSEPKTKPELVDECGVSRSTIDRWIRELQAADLVQRPADRFELTLLGRLVTREQARVHARFDQLLEVREPLMALSDETDIDSRVFENAEMKAYTGVAPHLGEQLLTQPGRMRVVAPNAAPVYSLFLFSDPNPGLELEAVLDARLISQLEAYALKQRMPLLAELDVEVYELEDPPPFCLALHEREERSTMYLIFGGVTTTVGVVKNTSPDAVTWGETVYRQYRNRATKRGWPEIDRPLDILRKRYRRVILLELMNGRVEHETDVVARSGTARDGDFEVEHDHLLKLEAAGYIEWDKETGTISMGPNFEEIEPVLELIETHANELPSGGL